MCRLVRVARGAAAAGDVPQQQGGARSDRGQHEHRVERGDRDPGGRPEPRCREGPRGGTLPWPPPADGQGDRPRGLDHHEQRDQLPQGRGAAGDPGRDDERGRVPGHDQDRCQHEPGPHLQDQQLATQVDGRRLDGSGQPRPAAAGCATHHQRGSAGHGRDPRQDVRQRGPDRRGQRQQEDGGQPGLDDLTPQPFPRHRAHAPRHVPAAPAVTHRPVHVTDHPADEHGVEEQGAVVGPGRARQAEFDAECPGDDPPPPGRTQRGEDSERAGGHDRRPGDRPHAVRERRRADEPHEKPQHGSAGGQAQHQRAEPADGATKPDRAWLHGGHTGGYADDARMVRLNCAPVDPWSVAAGTRSGGAVRTFRQETVLGTLVPPALLGVLALTSGLGVAGWVVGLAAGWTTTALLVGCRIRDGATTVPPADWITLTRALLAAGVAALVADSFDRPLRTAAVVVLATVALLLDAVDGQVARRTGTANPLGARFDSEVDAWLILVLSVAVARDSGGWVLAIGAARYALLVAGWAVPWLADSLPPRYWGKVVAAVTGIALTVAISGLLPRAVGMAVVGVALLLLVETFGRAVGWLYRTGAGERTRRVVRTLTALGAAAVVWAVLVAPTRLDRLTPAAFARVPIEGRSVPAVGRPLPARPRRALAAVAGVLIGLLALVEVLDLGFNEELGRPFDPVLDWGNLGPAIGVVRDSIGSVATGVRLGLLVVAIVLVLGLVTVATVRITSVAARHRRRTVGGIAVLGLVWALSAALSLQLVPGAAVASARAGGRVRA